MTAGEESEFPPVVCPLEDYPCSRRPSYLHVRGGSTILSVLKVNKENKKGHEVVGRRELYRRSQK